MLNYQRVLRLDAPGTEWAYRGFKKTNEFLRSGGQHVDGELWGTRIWWEIPAIKRGNSQFPIDEFPLNLHPLVGDFPASHVWWRRVSHVTWGFKTTVGWSKLGDSANPLRVWNAHGEMNMTMYIWCMDVGGSMIIFLEGPHNHKLMCKPIKL